MPLSMLNPYFFDFSKGFVKKKTEKGSQN